jgi:hypothetical protein
MDLIGTVCSSSSSDDEVHAVDEDDDEEVEDEGGRTEFPLLWLRVSQRTFKSRASASACRLSSAFMLTKIKRQDTVTNILWCREQHGELISKGIAQMG